MRGTTTHWEVVEDVRVQRTVRNAANSLADMNGGIVEADDLFQEGLVLVAGIPKIAEHAIVGEFGLVYSEVRERLFKQFIRPLDRTGELDARKYRSIPVDDADNEPQPVVMFDEGSGDYTADAVKMLLPAVWDEDYAYGLPDRDDAPDKDMPKSASNKARSNNHWAYIADIKTGWHKTPLTLLERRALFMRYALGDTQEMIARYEGVSQQMVGKRLDGAIKKIVARLNGAHIEEE